MPRRISNYGLARRRAYYLRLMRARRNCAGYRGQAFYKRQWPYVYRAMFRSKGLRRRYRYSTAAKMKRRNQLMWRAGARNVY